MDNTRGSLFMILAMAAFSVEDMLFKLAADYTSIGILLIMFGLGGMSIFMVLTWRRRETLVPLAIFSRPIFIRVACEITARLCFALAITLTPLSSASAILQATPLVVVLGAALIFGESVSVKRWLAIGVGFIGVLMIVRPGLDSFNAASLFAVISTLGFAGRDLATRGASSTISNVQLGIYGFLALIPAGILFELYQPAPFRFASEAAWLIAGIVVFGVMAYNALTIAMRKGAVSIVTPFRYTRLLFALILGVVVFNETPDAMTLMGASVIILSGIYILTQKDSNTVAPITRLDITSK
ncbi:DMT family transporter [Cobetia sp. QF-1]|uniref:DMT family transporter n=1 Tax=Cobetia sp. QF-1 TaxID=1969833 RepID=UPI001C3CBB97|nr:DMT family transporter [Cobetia sp. QF-1]